MKKNIFLLLTGFFLCLSVTVVAQSAGEPIAFKNIYVSKQADRILTTEIKKKELLKAPSSLFNGSLISTPLMPKSNNKKKVDLFFKHPAKFL